MGLGEVFSATWQDYKKNFKLVLKSFWWFNILPTIVLGAIFLVVLVLFLSSISQFGSQDYASTAYSGLSSLTGNAIRDSASMNSFGYLAVFVVFIIVFVVAMIVFSIYLGTTLYYASFYNEKNMRFKQAASGGSRYFWKFLGLSVLILLFIWLLYVPGVLSVIIDVVLWSMLDMTLKVVLVLLSITLFILAFIFSLYLGVSWLFSPYVLVRENKRITESMKFSRQMTKGRWWKVFGYFLLVGLIAGGINMVFAIPSFFISFFVSLFSFALLATRNMAGYVILLVLSLGIKYIFNLAASIVITPFIIFFFKNFYLEIRTKKGKK